MHESFLVDDVWSSEGKRTSKRMCFCSTAVFVLVLVLVMLLMYILSDLLPELQMVLHSRCDDPLHQWNRKAWGFRFSSDFVSTLSSMLRLVHDWTDNSGATSNTTNKPLPLILVGTHHRTGTFLAKKMFAKLCAELRLCCKFFISKDNLQDLASNITAGTNLLFHGAWAWAPSALGVANYRFVHFYRQPAKKIVSGYQYHLNGVEKWTWKYTRYYNACSVVDNSNGHRQLLVAHTRVKVSDAVRHCKAMHFCVECCLLEHNTSSICSNNDKDNGNDNATITINTRQSYAHKVLCKLHGNSTLTLQQKLQTRTSALALLTEAALEYYENRRMAVLYSAAQHDPRALNVDIDSFKTAAGFDSSIATILAFLSDALSLQQHQQQQHEVLARQLRFYDVQRSWLYRRSMDNAFNRHLNYPTGSAVNSNNNAYKTNTSSSGTSTTQTKLLLEHSHVFRTLYRDVLRLMANATDRA